MVRKIGNIRVFHKRSLVGLAFEGDGLGYLSRTVVHEVVDTGGAPVCRFVISCIARCVGRIDEVRAFQLEVICRQLYVTVLIGVYSRRESQAGIMYDVAHILERIVLTRPEVCVVERCDAASFLVGAEPCRLAEGCLCLIASLVECFLVGR